MRKNIIFVVLVLMLVVLAAVSAWQVYVPLQEDVESVRSYKDLTAYVHLPEISLLASSSIL